MNDQPTTDETLISVVKRIRPKLHRYCARMCGSIIEGEDVVQEAVLRAMRAQADGVEVENLEAWLFRIAHNAALISYDANHARRWILCSISIWWRIQIPSRAGWPLRPTCRCSCTCQPRSVAR